MVLVCCLQLAMTTDGPSAVTYCTRPSQLCCFQLSWACLPGWLPSASLGRRQVPYWYLWRQQRSHLLLEAFASSCWGPWSVVLACCLQLVLTTAAPVQSPAAPAGPSFAAFSFAGAGRGLDVQQRHKHFRCGRTSALTCPSQIASRLLLQRPWEPQAFGKGQSQVAGHLH